MTSTPSDPTPEGAVPPPPGAAVPPPPGAAVPPPAGAVPPPAYDAPPPGYNAPPPGYNAPPPGYNAPPPGYAAAAPLSDADQRMWAMLAHLGGIILGFIAPLIVWLMHKDRGRFVDDQAKESLNFQITIAIAFVVSIILMAVTFGLLFFLPWIVWLVMAVFAVIAGVAANKGETYRYPFNIRLVK